MALIFRCGKDCFFGAPCFGPEGVAQRAREYQCDRVDQPHWQVLYCPVTLHHSHCAVMSPWQIARVTIALVSDGPGDSFTTTMPAGLFARPGLGTLAEQLSTLPLFSLETGFLLHHKIKIIGQPHSFFRDEEFVRVCGNAQSDVVLSIRWWTATFQAQEVHADGYDVEEICLCDTLQRSPLESSWGITPPEDHCNPGTPIKVGFRLVKYQARHTQTVAIFPIL